MIGLLILAAAAGAELPLETRYDLTCAESAVSTLGWMGDKNDEAHSNVLEVVAFYLGSLSGRDPSTDWMAAVRTDMTANRRTEIYYDETLKSCTARMVERMRLPAQIG